MPAGADPQRVLAVTRPCSHASVDTHSRRLWQVSRSLANEGTRRVVINTSRRRNFDQILDPTPTLMPGADERSPSMGDNERPSRNPAPSGNQSNAVKSFRTGAPACRRPGTLANSARHESVPQAGGARYRPDVCRRSAGTQRFRLGTGKAGGEMSGYREALRYSEEACHLDPENGHLLNTLGVACYRGANYEKALDVLARSNKINTLRDNGPHPLSLPRHDAPATRPREGSRGRASAAAGADEGFAKIVRPDRLLFVLIVLGEGMHNSDGSCWVSGGGLYCSRGTEWRSSRLLKQIRLLR